MPCNTDYLPPHYQNVFKLKNKCKVTTSIGGVRYRRGTPKSLRERTPDLHLEKLKMHPSKERGEKHQDWKDSWVKQPAKAEEAGREQAVVFFRKDFSQRIIWLIWRSIFLAHSGFCLYKVKWKSVEVWARDDAWMRVKGVVLNIQAFQVAQW